MCGPRPSHSVASMSEDITPRPVLNAISFVVADMAATVEFYSQLGLEFDPDAANAPHAQATVAGMQIMFDTRAVVQANWTWPHSIRQLTALIDKARGYRAGRVSA